MVRPPLYTTGDSHSRFTFVDVPDVTVNHIGSITMHRVGRDRNYPYSFPNDGFWVFCYGEIDVRCHITPQIQEYKRVEEEIITTLVSNYISALEEVEEKHGCKISIMSIVPPTRFSTRWDNPEYPVRGSNQERSKYTKCINDLLAHECEKRKWLYLDIYSLYVDEDGMLPDVLTDGSVHIGNTSRVQEYMKQIFI